VRFEQRRSREALLHHQGQFLDGVVLAKLVSFPEFCRGGDVMDDGAALVVEVLLLACLESL
jgi:hypothetical protein